MSIFNKIKLVAIDVDGVLLTDTYSPAIRSFVEQHGGVYTKAGLGLSSYCRWAQYVLSLQTAMVGPKNYRSVFSTSWEVY